MPVTPGPVGENLRDVFKDQNIGAEPYFNEWCQVGAFLSDPECVIPAMADLDSAMYNKLTDRENGMFTADSFLHQKPRDAYMKYYSMGKSNTEELKQQKKLFSHLLSDVLTEYEESQGFNTDKPETQVNTNVSGIRSPDKRPHVPTYSGFVQPADFLIQLKAKAHWKDPGARSTHGEYTHRLQWYAVCHGLYQDNKTGANVFASLGNYDYVVEHEENNVIFSLTLWDIVCDRTNGQDVAHNAKGFRTVGSEDFRSPENLNIYLTENDSRGNYHFELLHNFLKARKGKREATAFDEKEYVAKKLFGLPSANLDRERIEVLEDVVETKTWKF